MEKEKATHSSIIAWKIPWTEELGGLKSMGSQRVGHDWGTEHNIGFTPYVKVNWIAAMTQTLERIQVLY